MKLTIEMPWEKDLSVNAYKYGKGGGYRKKEHVQDWMNALGWVCVDARLVHGTCAECGQRIVEWGKIDTLVSVTVDFRLPDKRRRDDHNYYKVICDAVAAGLGIDDKDIRISTGSVTVDKQNAGFTITVEDTR